MAGKNYAKGLPMGDNQIPFTTDAPPAVAAIASTTRENGVTSSILVLTQDTTSIEIAAATAPVFLKWLSQATVDSSVAGTSVISAAGTANYDHVIPTATTRRFVVPIFSIPSSQTSAMGANRANGLYPNVATITTPIASVFLTQYGSSNSY